MKSCYMLIGVPGSGKSTWVRKNNPLIGGIVASSDEFIEKIAFNTNRTYSEVFNASIKDAEIYFKNLIKVATDNDYNLIIDRTNINQNKRIAILNSIPKNYTKFGVVFNIEYNELLRRLEDREKLTQKSIPKHILDSMLKNYQEVNSEYEGFDSIIKIEA